MEYHKMKLMNRTFSADCTYNLMAVGPWMIWRLSVAWRANC